MTGPLFMIILGRASQTASIYKLVIFSFLVMVFSACGGSSSSSTPPTPVAEDNPQNSAIATGVFIDSAVEGLRYETATQSGLTNQYGQFNYVAGEMITFSFGDIVLPSVPASEQISPLEVFSTGDYYDVRVVNLARLLQSLDLDGIASNGITLAENIHTLAAGLSIDFSASDFDDMVVNLIANSGSLLTELITEKQAINHLLVSLNAPENLQNCTSTHSKVGQSGAFVSRFHSVSGTATIVNDCTILVTDFSYDGGGPSVHFYGAVNHAYDSVEAIRMGPPLQGTTYDQDVIVFGFLQSSIDKFDTMSVWCDEFNASFGDLQFSN